ncbi:MAG: hypothetical protein HYV27_13485 [Candidatus Hydrogenedentes bacterium]|nr:hypothetical protein [Candidatus Hydrogenedentota bacterium]
MTRPVALLLIASALAASCATTKDAATPTAPAATAAKPEGGPILGGRWYHYYERGLQFLEDMQYALAVADFQRALEARPVESQRARTYGMHFIPYFPSRELGIAYFHLGENDEAKSALQHSMDQLPSDRAQEYLNQLATAPE